MITLKANWEIPLSGVFSDVVVASQIEGIFASGDRGPILQVYTTSRSTWRSSQRVSSLVSFGK